ncbi:MAG: choice-of-anchor L domain-containing protein, partial [Flavisolibacter sp.]
MLTAFKNAAFAVCCLLITFSVKAQLQITPQTSAQALAQRLVGDGITISNVTISGSPLATGFFKNVGGTQIGLDSGIVLSTGRVLTSGTLYGFNGLQTNFASTTHNTPGDVQLSGIINNAETNDAIVLEFDFVPLGDTVKFNYVFSSEEYPTFTCSNFNDAFAFFITGPGITGTKNIALVPGTNIPVAINSI